MAHKDQLSSSKDRCDICGAALDEDSLIQGFPDGSVVALCADCAADAGPEEEVEASEDHEGDDATVEWSEPHDDNPTAPAPPNFEAEVFEPVDFEPQEPSAPAANPSYEAEYHPSDVDPAKVEAELAAWASAPTAGDEIREDEPDSGEDYDQEDLEEATLQLVAAIAEANMEDDEEETPPPPPAEMGPEAGPAPAPEVEMAPAAEPASPPEPALAPAADTPKEEIIDRTKELLVPVTDLLALQNEMQSALAKLSSTLEHFMTDVVESEEKTSAVNDRVQKLEDELESTRERLRVAESLLPESAVGAVAALAAATATTDTDLVSVAPPPLPPTTAASTPAPPPLMAAQTTPAVPPPVPTPVPPPIPPPVSAGKTGNAAASAAAGAAVGATAGALAPPPLPGLAAGAAAAGAAAAKAIVPPPLGGAKPGPTSGATSAPASAPTSPPPPLPPGGAPKKHLFKSSGEEVQESLEAEASFEPDAGADSLMDATSADELLVAPISSAPIPSAPISSPPVDLEPTPLSAPEAGLAPEPSPAPGPVSGAAAVANAAMQKLLRGRKAQPPPEPEPEPEPEPLEVPGLAFTINEVQVAQRYFNESEFVKKLSEIGRSIGKPQANVSRTAPGALEAAITVFWDIVWYQYLVDLRKDLKPGTKRVVMVQEGMDLEELEPRLREKNATINDDGRLDASELEVRLLSDPEALITNPEVSTPEARLADDATEEIWDQRAAPEFRWD